MKPLFLLALTAAVIQAPAPAFQQRTFRAPDGTTILYGLGVPADYDPGRPRPLVLVLHPGGGRTPYYGDLFMREIFYPGLSGLDPIMVAPDSPARTWSDPAAEQAVLALIDSIRAEFAIDRRRILVTGFSLGGGGAWFMSSRHADLFTGAIVLAGRTDEPLERLARIPTYVIHSRADWVAPFAPAEHRAAELERMGRIVRFEALEGVEHHDMGGYVDALQRGGRWVAERWGK